MIRLPAEWEAQSHVLLTWPDSTTDWAPRLPRVELLYRELVSILSRYVAVIIAVAPANVENVRSQLGTTMTTSAFPVNLYPTPMNDTWARDHGPISVYNTTQACLLDFTFNGWGNKYAAEHDNAITRQLHQQHAFGERPLVTEDWVLEGGAIESNGEGCLMTTRNCLLNPNRNPHLTQAEIEAKLSAAFGVNKILWLDHGSLEGDDTDSHIDTLARFAPNNTIVYIACDDEDDAHFAELKLMEAELAAFTNHAGEPFKLCALPFPSAKFDETGARLPATYANYLITNGAVLVPTYDDKNDALALARIAESYPQHEVIPLDCSVLVEQHGSLHCITMQVPAVTPLEL